MNITRYFWRAYNAHVLIIAFVVGLFTMVLVALQQNLSSAETSVKNSLGVVVFLQNHVTDAEATALAQSLKSQDPELVLVDYTSKEKAYEEAMKDPNLAKSLQLLKNNPLPASLTLHYSERAWWERIQPTEKLKSTPEIQEIRWDPQAYAIYRSVHRWRLWGLRFSMFLAMVLVVWAFIGLYRFLSLAGQIQDIAGILMVGMFGGLLAWALWGFGLHTIQAEITGLRPLWVGLIPAALGLISALGCYGLEVRRAE